MPHRSIPPPKCIRKTHGCFALSGPCLSSINPRGGPPASSRKLSRPASAGGKTTRNCSGLRRCWVQISHTSYPQTVTTYDLQQRAQVPQGSLIEGSIAPRRDGVVGFQEEVTVIGKA